MAYDLNRNAAEPGFMTTRAAIVDRRKREKDAEPGRHPCLPSQKPQFATIKSDRNQIAEPLANLRFAQPIRIRCHLGVLGVNSVMISICQMTLTFSAFDFPVLRSSPTS